MSEIDSAGIQSFLILGSAKCGTTSLYEYLDAHPDLLFSDPKEPIFFEAQFERGLAFYRDSYFGAWKGEHAVGDARTHNLFLPYVPGRIHELLPECRLIAIVRNPVERSFSHWWHRVAGGIEHDDFPSAMRANLARIEGGQDFEGEAGARRWREGLYNESRTITRHACYLEMSYYAEQIERYRALFPAPQLKIVLFEDLKNDAEKVVREVWDFLGIDASLPMGDLRPRNVARARVRSPLAARLRRLPLQPLRRYLPAGLRRRAGSFLAGAPARQPELDEESEAWLLEHFASHNRALEKQLGRSLPGWFQTRRERTRANSDAGRDPGSNPGAA